MIEKNNIKEGNKNIEVAMAGTGADTWGLMAMLDPAISGYQRGGTYATYYNKAEQKIKFMLKEPWVKEHLYQYYKLVNE